MGNNVFISSYGNENDQDEDNEEDDDD